MKKFSHWLLGTAVAMSALSANATTFVGDRTDFRDETIYFAMTTRFYDGDITNNTYCWDGLLNVDDPEWRGDFKGLIEKLDYIKALGFTAVWITPIVENASGLDYHGYHAINHGKVEPRLLSDDVSFQTVIDEVHKRDMKLVLDVVLQHTGNFGEEFLMPMFEKDYTQNLSNIHKSLHLHPNTVLSPDYSLASKTAYHDRWIMLSNEDNINHDSRNIYHHSGYNWDWDDYRRVWGTIAGDCVDLNTENPYVSNYIVKCYSKFISMGVDALRIDTGGHIARLTFNNAFLPGLIAAGEAAKEKRGGTPFFMYTEVCARAEEVIYRNGDYNCSPCYYTWKESKDYPWDYSETSWNDVVVLNGERGDHVNANSVLQQDDDDAGQSTIRHSNNAWLDGNDYRTPDYTDYSGLSVIDFPWHWRAHNASNSFGVRSQDDYYNDATFNVVYTDSHDYGPNGADKQRYAFGTNKLVECQALMFTWRGIPCVYYGTEVEFRAGELIDKGALLALKDGGRAYFGGYIKGDVNVTDFAEYSDATGNMAATLTHPVAYNLQRLNKIRAAVPALRKGQYSTDGCSGNMAFKRRYVDDKTDSYCLVTISGNATFTGILNGKYTDVVTGDVKNVTDGKLTATCSGQGNLRVYVLDTEKTKAPGKVGEDTKFIYGTTPGGIVQKGYDGTEEEGETVTKRDLPGPNPFDERKEPDPVIIPAMEAGEQAIFLYHESWASATAWIWDEKVNYTGGAWPGQKIQYLGNNMYKWTYTGTATIPEDARIIFSNAGNEQSPSKDQGGYKFVNGGVYKLGSDLEPYDIITASGLSVSISPNGGNFTDTQEITIRANNATSSWYKIGNGAQTAFNGTATFSIGADMDFGESVTVSWSATDGTETKTGSAIFTKIEKVSTVWHLYFDDSESNWGSVNCYIYGAGHECHEITGKWPGTAMTKAGAFFEYTVETDGALNECNVIFNGAGKQTGDNVKVRNYGIYNAKGDTGLSGVSDIVADEYAPEEYYNLQGMRIDRPTDAGVYLVKKGNKVSKMIIR